MKMFGNLKQYTTLKGWEMPIHASNFSPTGDNRWSNKDMDPTPKEEQIWGTWNFVSYWICDAYGPGSLQLAGSMIAVGLSYKTAILAVFAGNLVISWACWANGTVGATLHTPFSVTVRGSFGFWGSYFAVVSRLVLATVWFGVNSYSGAQALYQCFRGLWPGIVNIPNHLPESSGITTSLMMCFFVYFVLQTCMAMVSPAKLRYAFAFKSIIGPMAGFAMMGYYVHKSKGAVYQGSAEVKGSKLAWVWLAAMNSSAGSYSTLSVNIGDFTRYAKGPRQQHIQLFVIPTAFTLTALSGVYLASGAAVVNGGEVDFNPLTIMNHWNNRAALFFVGFAFMTCQLCTNISANSLSASNDWCVLFPKYLSIRRGAFLTSLLGCWCMAPWKGLSKFSSQKKSDGLLRLPNAHTLPSLTVLASAGSFLSFMGGYVIFMAPICGILIADYWFIKHGKVDIPALYNPHGRYRFGKFGTNWRMVVTMLLAVVPLMPGFVNSINPSIPLNKSMQNFYSVAWLFGTAVSLIFYTAFSKFWPNPDIMIDHLITGEEFARPHLGRNASEIGSQDDPEKKEEVSSNVVPVLA